jgi:hypothetical protein
VSILALAINPILSLSLSLSLSKLNKKDFAVLWVLSVINIFIFFLLVGSEGH